MRIAIYCRVATADQLALDMQEARLREYCISRGYEIVAIVREFYPGLTLDRPGIHTLNSLAEDHRIDGVLATDYSRIARRPADLMDFYDGLREKGVDCRIANKEEAFQDLPSVSDLLNNDELFLAFGRFWRKNQGGRKHER